MSEGVADRDVAEHVAAVWRDEIIPALHDYIAIPNVSVAYDPQWKAHGHMDRAVELLHGWAAGRAIAGMVIDVQEIDGRTPLIVIDIPAANGGPGDDTVVLYGHLDKQPEMTGWRADLGPWKPVRDGDRLYGRGGADDGYAMFASLAAIEAAHAAGYPTARCVALIEASEESGSPDLPAHLELLGDRLGTPSLVVCLDSGAMDYERMWITTSLRGMASGVLRVEVLTEGVHSGEASGIVPSSFRILRQLLDRVEDSASGRILLDDFHVEIPADRVAEAADTAASFDAAEVYPWVDGVRPMVDDPAEQLLARTWRPTLSVTGVDGIPPVGKAGNVLRPFTEVTLSLRLPPTADAERAVQALHRALTSNPPSGARVSFEIKDVANGWNAPAAAEWLTDAVNRGSMVAFNRPARTFGEGGSVPFMGMLGERYPDAQFVITGVLGPGSNAHGPNEFIDLPLAEGLTVALAEILAHHARRHR